MSSRFKDIFEARHHERGAPAEEVAPPSPAPEETPQNNPLPSQPNQPPAAEKRRGRPTGKRSDGEHIQVTAYIRRETHHAVKVALLQGGKGKEFSELVQELLAKWLKSRT